jgi:hypothetical protein
MEDIGNLGYKFKRYNKNQNKFSKPLVFFNKIKKKVLPPKKIKQTNKNKKNPPRQKKSSIQNGRYWKLGL